MFAQILESTKDNYPAPKSTVMVKLTNEKAIGFLTKIAKVDILPKSLKEKKFFLSNGIPGTLIYNEYAFAIACRNTLTHKDCIRVFIRESEDSITKGEFYLEVASKTFGEFNNPKGLDSYVKEVLKALSKNMTSFWKLRKAIDSTGIKWIASEKQEKLLAHWGKENPSDIENPEKEFPLKNKNIMRKGDFEDETPKHRKLNLTTKILKLDKPEAFNLAFKNYLIDSESEIYLTDGEPGVLAYNDCCMAILYNPEKVDVNYKLRHGHNRIKIAYGQLSKPDNKMLAYLSPAGLNPKTARKNIFMDTVCKNMGSRERLEKALPKQGFIRNEQNKEIVDATSINW